MQKQYSPKKPQQGEKYTATSISVSFPPMYNGGVSILMSLSSFIGYPLTQQNMKIHSSVIKVTWKIHLLMSFSTLSSNSHMSERLARIFIISVQTTPQNQACKRELVTITQ